MSASTSQQIFEIAEEIVQHMEARRSALQAELAKIEARKREIDLALRATKLGRERLANFQIKIGPDYQCPSCWVRNEQRTTLSAIPSDTKDNLYRCDDRTCDQVVRIVWSL